MIQLHEYDGHDRLSKTRFPVATQGANSSSTTDYEQLTYDAASNVTNRRLRDGNSIGFTFDNLNRATFKDLPGSEPDVTYAYDNLGRLTSASQTGHSLTLTYDALSRNLTQVGPQGTVSSQWDLAGRRTRLTYPGSGLYVDYDYLVTGDMTKIRENGATSGIGVLATFSYDDLGRRTGITFGNGVTQTFTFDPVSRLASLSNELSGTTNDLSATFAYNPSSQISSTVRTGDTYAWTGHFNQNTSSTANGLNQIGNVGSKTITHDSKGNITAIGTRSFTYSSENLLLTGPGSTTLGYDPVMRLYQSDSGSTARFAYDGLDRIAEYDGSNALQRRYVHGPGMDEPLVWYEGSGTTDRRFLSSDERGSIISVTDGSGAVLALNKYDEFGQPQSTNLGVFGYTGQAWLSEVGAWYYKARAYDPEPGRFLQTDPIGYEDSPNLYAYVLNDPVNFVDPLGLHGCGDECVLVEARRRAEFPVTGSIGGLGPGSAPGADSVDEQIVVICDAECRAKIKAKLKKKQASRPSPFCQQVLDTLNGIDNALSELAGILTDAELLALGVSAPTGGATAPIAMAAGAGSTFAGGATIPVTFAKGLATGDYRQFGARLASFALLLGQERGIGRSRILRKIPGLNNLIGRVTNKIEEISPTPRCPVGVN